MADGNLSQEEIDALLMGTDDLASGMDVGGGSAAAAGVATAGPKLSPAHKEMLADALTEVMQNAASSLGTLLSRTVSITNPTVSDVPVANLMADAKSGSAIIKMNMGVTPSAMTIPADFAKKISMISMGTDNEPANLTEAHLSTLNELGTPFLSAISNGLSDRFRDNLMPMPGGTEVLSNANQLPAFTTDPVTKVLYNVNIDGIPSGKISHYIDTGSAVRWAENLIKSESEKMDTGGQTQPKKQVKEETGVPYNPVNFPSLQQSTQNVQLPANYELLLDVQMNLTVELGRTRKLVKEVLQLGEGSIIELDKLAGEPVDLLINDKKIAQGEVVVIDENFGVRVTDIVGPAERLAQATSQMG